jgi:hypothetical protein
MNRKLLVVMLLTAVVAAEGCRRSGGERNVKPPLSVQKETDLLYTRKGDVIGAGLDPIAKAGAAPVLTEEQQKLAQAADAIAKTLKEEADKKKRRDDTVALGNFLLNYRKSKPATIYSRDDLKKALRREKKTDMYDDVDKGNIEVVYLADAYNPNHIMCYHKTVETQEDLPNKKTINLGYPAVFGGDPAGVARFGFLQIADAPVRVKEQELLVGWQYYVQFATPHFYRTSAEFPAYVPSALTQQPPVFLARIKLKSPDLLKNPRDEFNHDRFKKYLTENAPPHLLKLITDNALCVGLSADLKNPSELVMGQVVKERPGEDGKEKGNLGINASGTIGYYDADQMKLWVAQNQLKK